MAMLNNQMVYIYTYLYIYIQFICIYDMGSNSWPQGIPRSIGHCYGQSIELKLGLRLTHTDQEATYRELVGRSMLLFQRGLVNLKGSPLFEIPGFDSRPMFVASLYTVACHSCCYANHPCTHLWWRN